MLLKEIFRCGTRKFWFRSFQYLPFAAAYHALRSLAKIPQLLFGNDFPYWSPGVAVEELRQLGLSAAEIDDIEVNNARRLLPGLSCSSASPVDKIS